MRVSWLPKAFILFISFIGNYAAASCADEQRFGDDGRTTKWIICNGNVPINIVESSSGRFEITLSVDGDLIPERLHWAQTAEVSPDGSELRAVNSSETIELFRHISRVSTNERAETISVRNLWPHEIGDVRLRVRIGRAIELGPDEPKGLAKQIYWFQKYLQSDEIGQWSLANENGTADRFALYSRHRVLAVEASQPSTFVRDTDPGNGESWFLETHIASIPAQGGASFTITASVFTTSTPSLSDTKLRGLMYSDLWGPLAKISETVERLLGKLTTISGNAGLAMIILAILIRILTFPVTYWSMRQQKTFAAANKVMKPKISEIRKLYKGAEQSERILGVYKEHNISPFSGLKGSVGLFIQIPFLLAVFHVTTESSILENANFLWVENLALSDSLIVLPFTIPILGNAINVLPLSLGVLNILSGKRESADTGTSAITPVAISLVIVILFYTVSAALVLYWLAINTLQAVERVVFNRRLSG